MDRRHLLTDLICNNYIVPGLLEEDFNDLPRPYYTLAYVLSGRLECIEGNRVVVGEPGDVIFFPYHLRYLLRWVGDPVSSTYSCHFLLPPQSDPFSGRVVPLQRLSGEGAEEDFSYIYQNISNRERSLGVLGRFYSLCDRLYRQMEAADAPPMDERIRKALRYIDAHASFSFSVEELAAVGNMSTSRFYHCFKKETGLTPITYKNQVAVRRAAMLLVSDREKSIEEISAETGFASSAYFRRVFKAVTGQLPRDYRKGLK
ncbi:MAG: helix-turn-helix domain-containing protein [Clostridia bacterium]|nr:helix-turn-helix domain-containing protein [Clostridia bacterium]